MPVPANFGHPIKRPNFLLAADFIGGDEDLALEVQFPNALGQITSLSLQLNGENLGEMCLPSSLQVIGTLSDAALKAHLRMATMISGTVPPSQEWKDALIQHEASNKFQTAIGNVQMDEVVVVDEVCADFIFKKSGTSQLKTVRTTYDELTKYDLNPETQLRIIAGAIEKQFPQYVHDHPATVLSASKRQDIIDFLLGPDFQPWI